MTNNEKSLFGNNFFTDFFVNFVYWCKFGWKMKNKSSHRRASSLSFVFHSYFLSVRNFFSSSVFFLPQAHEITVAISNTHVRRFGAGLAPDDRAPGVENAEFVSETRQKLLFSLSFLLSLCLSLVLFGCHRSRRVISSTGGRDRALSGARLPSRVSVGDALPVVPATAPAWGAKCFDPPPQYSLSLSQSSTLLTLGFLSSSSRFLSPSPIPFTTYPQLATLFNKQPTAHEYNPYAVHIHKYIFIQVHPTNYIRKINENLMKESNKHRHLVRTIPQINFQT